MSTFNRNTLALALAAALLPASAFAFDITTNGDTAGEPIAQQTGATNVLMTEVIEINADGITDQLIGRTTGFGVRLLLPAGVTVNAATLGDDGTATPPLDLAPDSNVPADTTNDWAASAATFGPAAVVWNVSPVGASATIAAGTILTISGLNLSGVSTTASTNGTIQLFDPNTNAVIAQANVVLINRVDGLAFTCAAQANVDKIDVAGDGGAVLPKTQFVPFNAAIGTGPFATTEALGAITVAATAGFALNVAAGADTLTSKITGTDLAPFSAIFLSSNATCANTLASYAINTTTNIADLDVDFDAINTVVAGTFTAAGGTATLCVTVDAATEVTAQQFTVQNGINTVLENDACNVAPIAFNGSVVKVFTFNPAGNTTQESFLRVSNWGNTGGKVTVEGWDDAGAAGASDITFTLPAGESLQFNSGDVENGNATKFTSGAFGDGAGKWRLVVTGEFDGMNVISLNRNNTVGTLTNLTDSDNGGEQKSDSK